MNDFQGLKKHSFERDAWGKKRLICGIDEVGRGCLAGPVVAAAVILKNYRGSNAIKDSKLLSDIQLSKGYAWILKNAFISVGIINNNIIDQRNIYQATLLAMNKAVTNLLTTSSEFPLSILIDAMPLKLYNTAYEHIPIYYFPKGEEHSISIAAASIVAKVTRDEIMRKFSLIFPGYNFEQNKGYGTRLHLQAIEKYGQTILHRNSFLNGLSLEGENDECQQTTLC